MVRSWKNFECKTKVDSVADEYGTITCIGRVCRAVLENRMAQSPNELFFSEYFCVPTTNGVSNGRDFLIEDNTETTLFKHMAE